MLNGKLRPLAMKILEGEYREGDTVSIGVGKEGNFTFKRSKRDEGKSPASD